MILILSCIALPVTKASPLWFRQGVYARYGGVGSRSGMTVNWIPFSYDCFQWECLSLEGNIAVLNVSIIANQRILFLTCINVNIENRSVGFPNGTYIGKTWLWLPANPSPDEDLELTDNKSEKPQVTGWMDTCQGAQKCFIVEVGGYDLDTGLAIQPHLINEPTILALGVYDIDGPVITSTNIDLGPREWWVEIVRSLPIVIPIIGFVGILLFVRHKRQQKKKQRKALMEKQRKTQKQPLQTPEKTNASLQDKVG